MSSVTVAATDGFRFHGHYRGPYTFDYHDRLAGFSDFSSPVYDAAAVLSSRSQNSRTPVKSGPQRPWSFARDHEGYLGKSFMSERPANPDRPGASSAADSQPPPGQQPGPSSELSQPQHEPRTGAPSSNAPSPASHSQQQSPRSYGLPPLPPVSISTGSSLSASASRVADVSSILNPSSADDVGHGKRRKASELDSPSASLPPPPPSSSIGRPVASPVSSFSGLPERATRRTLTPRSPLHRTTSLGQLNPPASSISAQHTPFLGSPRSRNYTIEPGVTSGAPQLPTPPAAARPSYGFPGPTPPSNAARRMSSGATRAAGGASASASPATSFSSFSQAGQTSPPMQSGSRAAPLAPYSEVPSGASTATAMQERQTPVSIPISSSGGQNVYQMMTLETTSGTVQLPVDVQAASRVADEKRRRNAGASARFRQRRKEKERESSITISRLEQQVKELSEDADFYKRERDYLTGVLLHVPGGDRHLPRPPSPRRRRSSSAQGASIGSASGYSRIPEAPHSPEQGRNVRRRTSTLSLPPPPPPPAALPAQGAAPYQPSYPHAYIATIAPQPPPGVQQPAGPAPSPLMRGTLLPPGNALPPIQPPPGPGPPQLMQAAPQTGPWNPYAPDRRLEPPGRLDPSRNSR